MLVAGEPGIGKSTLLTQVALFQSSKVLYVCGEESPSQVALRVKRLGGTVSESNLLLLESTDADELVSVHVFDIAGRAVDVHREGNFFEMHGPDGMYFVRVVTINGSNEMRCTYPLVISHRDK